MRKTFKTNASGILQDTFGEKDKKSGIAHVDDG